jgi:epsilon-lactone hydrolase
MTMIYHNEYPADHAVMQKLRAEFGLHPAMEFGPAARSFFDQQMLQTPAAEEVDYEAATVGGVSGWWCRPSDAIKDAAILYFHGGAYVLGSAAAYRNFVGQIAVRAKAFTFIADYKLAPEHRFPCAMEDAFAAYRGLSAAGFSSLALAGDSAGGGLALSLLSLAMVASQDSSVTRPSAAAVMSPWTDLTLTGNSIETKSSSDPLLTRVALEKAAKLYLDEDDQRDPRGSPLFGNLTGLPPVLLHVGEDEILLDDSRRFAERISSLGGVAHLCVWQGMVHVFSSNLQLRAASEALDDIGDFLRSHLEMAVPMERYLLSLCTVVRML